MITSFCRKLHWDLLAGMLGSLAGRLSLGAGEDILPLARIGAIEVRYYSDIIVERFISPIFCENLYYIVVAANKCTLPSTAEERGALPGRHRSVRGASRRGNTC